MIIGAKTYEELIKYKIIAEISIDGVAQESDIVGALFGQTEGLLDEDMDLKQLQNHGRIGRIDLKISHAGGKTTGKLELPTSLSKVESAILAATLETVDRVGPRNAKISLLSIEDVRVAKRKAIEERAAEIMRQWHADNAGGNIADRVLQKSRKEKIVLYGPEKLAAGPDVYNSDEIILVEGRADVEKLLKCRITNAIELRGSKISPFIRTLCKNKTVTAFLDGDRGGDFLLKELASTVAVDFVARAPVRKEVEKLSKGQIYKALENKIPLNDSVFISEKQNVSEFLDGIGADKKKSKKSRLSRISKSQRKAKLSKPVTKKSRYKKKSETEDVSDVATSLPAPAKSRYVKKSKKKETISRYSQKKSQRRRQKPVRKVRKIAVPPELKEYAESIKQTFNTIFLDTEKKVLTTVPTSEAYNYLSSNGTVWSIIIDGVITQRLLDLAREKNVEYVIGAVLGPVSRASPDDKLTYATYSRI